MSLVAAGKKTREATPHPLGKCLLFGPLSSLNFRCSSLHGGGGGVDIFWNYTTVKMSVEQEISKGNYTSVFIQLLVFTNFAIKKPIVSRSRVDISPSSLLGSNCCTNILSSSERPQLARPGPPIWGVCGKKHNQLSNGHLTWAWRLRGRLEIRENVEVLVVYSHQGRCTQYNNNIDQTAT